MTAPRVTWIERALIRHLARRRVPPRRIARAFGRNRATVYIHCRGIERRPTPPLTDEARRIIAKDRRDLLRSHRLCLNGGHHGPATHGVLCAACRETHRRSA